ncbi:MAG: hypothetical protein OEY01_08390 [Desulfobulbaceae bacterium]|nr:hypothetical protein [Desulfobulbaceae bacterium]HIJ79022.1 hypothetical protein [Deltaproteobacteria bacterium]
MRLEISHSFLARGADLAAAGGHALGFLEKSNLVHYHAVRVIEADCCPATEPKFWALLEEGEAANRRALAALLAELQEAGVDSLDQLLRLDQGLESKVLHTIAHLLDGFFGIDSEFYNLPEDAHWLSAALRAEIKAAPGEFWLVRVAATLTALERNAVVALRSFEK